MTSNREHIARQAQHFENETKASSGWWILPLAIVGVLIWIATFWGVVVGVTSLFFWWLL